MFLAIEGFNPFVFIPLGFLQFLLPLALGATALMNMSARNSAAATLAEPEITEGQARGSVIQEYADRGMLISPNDPIVQEAMRRRSLASRKQQAQLTLGGPDPLGMLFGAFVK